MFEVRWLNTLNAISAATWDSLFTRDYPFCRYAFLAALEHGHSVDGKTGWQSQHLTVWHNNTLIAAIPGYLKTHSYGEYLFDWAIAEAYAQYRLPFYPKWLAAIPFTPVSGPRIGVGAPYTVAMVLPFIVNTLQQCLRHETICSVQWLYLENDLLNSLPKPQYLTRNDVQFLWQNHGYRQFSDFTQGLTSRKRKQMMRERLACQHLPIKTLAGPDITSVEWSQIIACYQATYVKRSGHTGYITPESFMLMARDMAKDIVVFACYAVDAPDTLIAAALCFRGKDTLYGRHWGALTQNSLLHFELCYYQGMEYCIQQGLTYFDAGTQGEHKLKRGFSPITRYGAYAFAETPLLPHIERYFLTEQTQLANYILAANAALPYRQ